MKGYEVPIERLTTDPVDMVAQLVRAAGVKRCANEGCYVRWVGGHGKRIYCSTECASNADRRKRADKHFHQSGEPVK